ncbi:MAG: glycosyltransferase family 39 protein, partial [bacterium]|nr:glycosyltransferase family 39 protein [bacterium]
MKSKEKIILLSLILLYFVTRLINLDILPITTDEAIYLHWARIIGDDFGQLFLPLMDGKTPLFMWLVIPFLKLIADPFIAGRVLSVLFGFGTLMTLLLLARSLFGGKAWIWVGLLYLVTPFALMHDRLALVEGMLLFWEVLFLYFLVRLAQHPSVWSAIVVGGT